MMSPKEIKELREKLEQFRDEHEEQLERNYQTDSVDATIETLVQEEDKTTEEVFVKITLRLDSGETASGIIDNMFEEAKESDCFGQNWVDGEILKTTQWTITKKKNGAKAK